MAARPGRGRRGGVPSAAPLSLTPQQRRFMIALQRRLAARPDVGPTFEEIRVDMGMSSKSGVSRLIAGLVERGRIGMMEQKQRSLVVLVPVEEDGSDEVGGVPLIQTFSDEEFLMEASRRGLLVRVC